MSYLQQRKKNKDTELVKDLLKGLEAKLIAGAKGDLSLQVFNLFAEARRIQELHTEEEAHIPSVRFKAQTKLLNEILW